MAKVSRILLMLPLLTAVLLFSGCGEGRPGADDKTDIRIIRSTLKKADQTRHAEARIRYLREACVMADALDDTWPGSEKVRVFLQQNEQTLRTIPDQVLALARSSRDLEAYRWAVERGAEVDLSYAALQQIWKMGKEWRDFYVGTYRDQTLPIFMSEAVNQNNRRFFEQYIDAFRAGGYPLIFPLDAAEFNPRFRHFIAGMLQEALEKKDTPRISALLTDMPPRRPEEHVDRETAEVMRHLSAYVFHEVRDEALACRLIELGYPTVEIDLDKSGFGNAFGRALLASPENAIVNVFRLNVWKGPLPEKEMRFILLLDDPPLRLLYPQYLTDAVAEAMRRKDTDKTLRFIRLREEIAPVSLAEYERLLNLSIELNSRTVYDYVRGRFSQIDPFTADLTELAQNDLLFKMYAPKVFAKIYPTADVNARPDGTTVGRIDRMLSRHVPEAALYAVKQDALEDAWSEAGMKRTLLMAVCQGGNLEAAKYLIETKRADVDAQTDYSTAVVTMFGSADDREGRLTPLFFAAISGNEKLIQYLVTDRRAEVNARSNFGATPLMYAAANSRTDAVRALLRLGADVKASVNQATSIPVDGGDPAGVTEGDTAYSIARRTGNSEMVEMLRRAASR